MDLTLIAIDRHAHNPLPWGPISFEGSKQWDAAKQFPKTPMVLQSSQKGWQAHALKQVNHRPWCPRFPGVGFWGYYQFSPF